MKDGFSALLAFDLFYSLNKKEIEYALLLIRQGNYETRNIAKKNGSTRELTIPHEIIAAIQRKLNKELQRIYNRPQCVYSFIKKSSIKKNALNHIRKKFLINVDISNFFDSINFGRVRGFFIKHLSLSEKIATKLAQLVTYKNKLPQGAPSSPIISNFICHKLDRQFVKFAKNNAIFYTRYADDLTFSTNKTDINEESLLKGIQSIVKANGFELNPKKTRIQKKNQSQKVTGLKVNRKINLDKEYLRKIRAMLFACYTKGFQEASENHFKKESSQVNKYKRINEDTFKRIILGKINFAKFILGKDSYTPQKLAMTLDLLSNKCLSESYCKKNSWVEKIDLTETSKLRLLFAPIYNSAIIHVEGESDITYLKNALKYFHQKGEFVNLFLRFIHHGGVSNLKKMYDLIHEKNPKIDHYNSLHSFLNKNQTHFFVLDSDTAEKNHFKRKNKQDFYLINEDYSGFIEQLFDKDFVVNIINDYSEIINPNLPKNENSRNKLHEHIKKINQEDTYKDNIHSIENLIVYKDNIHSIENLIVYKDKCIKKVDLAKRISSSALTDWCSFSNIFQRIQNYLPEEQKLFKQFAMNGRPSQESK
jgi:RNA-directed DNA polymerase